MKEDDILNELEAAYKSLAEQKKALSRALRICTDTIYRINKLRSKIKKQIKKKEL